MNRNVLLTSIAAILLSSATACTFAADGSHNMYGSPSTSTYVNRTIMIGPNTNYANVTKGEVIKFVVGDKTFAWQFSEVSTISEVDLNAIAPAGLLDHTVKVYLRRDPTTDGG